MYRNAIVIIIFLVFIFLLQMSLPIKATEHKEPPGWKDRWYVNTVWYQIFPDRFFNGDSANDPDFIETYDQNGQLHKQKPLLWTNDSPNWLSKYGGDINGIDKKLPWLTELGIDSIWLNPIFKATSNHKYNTSDYAMIDPSFGDREDLKTLLKHMHDNNMHLILDGVFNHSGYEFWAFQDIVKNGEKSPYSNWYYIKSYPVTELWKQSEKNQANYECWWGIGSLPKLNVDNPDTKGYLIDTCKSWMKLGIDGWRLDVPEEIKSPTFWKEWSAEMKKCKNDAYLSGEIWGEAKEWLSGDKFDGIMNYHGFREPVLQYFSAGKLTVSRFDRLLNERRRLYPHYINCAMQNLLSSHDTVRILSAMKNRDEKDSDKEKKNYDKGAADHKTIEKYKMVVLFQMTYVGSPMIYYGDEIGMVGGKDPDCRRPMIWDESEQNKDILNWYKKLIAVRKAHKSLRTGDFETVFANDKQNTYCYKRTEGTDSVTVCINYSDSEQKISIPAEKNTKFKDLITNETFDTGKKALSVKMKPMSGIILKEQK